MAEINDPQPGDNSHWLLLRILRRLKDILTATEAPVSIGDVTLTASDIEIGAVEIKNGADDTRAVVKTSDGGAGEAGILVRAIPSATAQPVSISGTIPVSDAGGSLTVDGSVSVSNLPATQAVSATQLPAALVSGRLDVNIGGASGALPVNDNGGSLTVDGPVTDAELRATPVPVSGTFFQATQPVSIAAAVPVNDAGGSLTVDGTVAVSNFPVTQQVSGPLTDAELRAVAVPVSGTFFPATQPVSGTVAIGGSVAVTGPLTDAELRAVAVPVSGTFFQATQPVSAAALPLPAGAATEATLASIDAGVPAALGQATMAASMPVVIASDQPAIPVSVASAVVSNAGVFAVQDSEKITDNEIFTVGASKVQPAGFFLSEVAGTLLSEDDAAAARVDNKRAQIHVLEDRDTRGHRSRVFSSGALRVDSTEANDTLKLILEELRESRRILCEIGRLNYETIE